MNEMEEDGKRISSYRDKLETGILKLEGTSVNGNREHRLPNVTNISFKHVDGNNLLIGINKDIAVSSGSACTSALPEPSHVLKAMGLEDDLARSSIRFAIGRFTREEEIEYAVEHVSKTIKQLRETLIA